MLHGCYDISNFGDQLLATILSARLTKLFGQEVLVPMRGRRSYWHWLKPFISAGLVVYGGGGYFCDVSGGFRARVLHHIKYLLPALILRSRRAPYVVFGAGAGPLKSQIGWLTARIVGQGARLVVMRDQPSGDLMSRAGVEPSKLRVLADLALGLRRDDIEKGAIAKATELLRAGRGRKVIGVHLQSLAMAAPEYFERVCDRLAQLMQTSSDRFLVFFSDHGNSAETSYLSVLDKHKISPAQAVVLPRQPDDVTLALISCFDAVLTSKLHVGITAYALEVAAFSLWTHEKTPRFYAMIGRSDSQARFEDFDRHLDRWWPRMGSEAERARVSEEATVRRHFGDEIEVSLRETLGPFVDVVSAG